MEQAPTVLIVNDNPTMIKILEASLIKQGFQTITTFFAQEAQTIAQQEKPNLILLDTQLSADETGFDVIKALKKNRLTVSIPVIFLGEDDLESKLAGFDLGAVDYITTPFQPLEVCARVRVHFKKHNTLKRTDSNREAE